MSARRAADLTLHALARQILCDALTQTGERSHSQHVRDLATRIGSLEQAARVAITLLDAAAERGEDQ